MQQLPPIPTPPAQRWREFRIQILPLIVFVIALLVVVVLWRNFVQPVGIVGEVETIQANVTSIIPGVLTDLKVGLFQEVAEGEVIGTVMTNEPEYVRAQLRALEEDIRVLGQRVLTDRNRLLQDYYGLRLDWLLQQVELAGQQAMLKQASNAYVRSKALIENPRSSIVSTNEFEALEAEFRSLQSQVAMREMIVEEMSAELKSMKSANEALSGDPITSAIEAQLAEIEMMSAPSVLRAPIRGTVSAVFRRSGERIVEGEPIVTISSGEASRIIGYVRQPVTVRPSTNDSVTVTTRQQPRQTAKAQILQVGAQMEIIRPGLLTPDATHIETGLPILVSLPSGLNVVPGEYVDLNIDYASE